jgi:hypothetical protein
MGQQDNPMLDGYQIYAKIPHSKMESGIFVWS